MLSAISESAAASRRKSISTVTERRKVSTTSIKPKPPRVGGKIFGTLGDETDESAQIGVEAPLDAGAQHFDRDRTWTVRGGDLGAMHLRNRRGSDRRPEAGEHRADRAANEAATTASASFCGKGGIRSCKRSRSGRAQRRPRPNGWRETVQA